MRSLLVVIIVVVVFVLLAAVVLLMLLMFSAFDDFAGFVGFVAFLGDFLLDLGVLASLFFCCFLGVVLFIVLFCWCCLVVTL